MTRKAKAIETRDLSFEELSILIENKNCKLIKWENWEKGFNWKKFFVELGNPEADLFLIDGKVYVPCSAGLWETPIKEEEVEYLIEEIEKGEIREDFYFRLYERRIKKQEEVLKKCQILSIKDRYSVGDNKLFMVMGENDAWVEVLLPNMEKGNFLIENVFG